MYNQIKPRRKITVSIFSLIFYILSFLISYSFYLFNYSVDEKVYISFTLLIVWLCACFFTAILFFEKLDYKDGKISFYNVLKFQNIELSSCNIDDVCIEENIARGFSYKTLVVKYYLSCFPKQARFVVYNKHDLIYLAAMYKKNENENKNKDKIIIRKKYFPCLGFFILNAVLFLTFLLWIIFDKKYF